MLFSQLQVNILNNRCGNYHFKVRQQQQQQQKHHIALNVSQEIVFFARSMKGLNSVTAGRFCFCFVFLVTPIDKGG